MRAVLPAKRIECLSTQSWDFYTPHNPVQQGKGLIQFLFHLQVPLLQTCDYTVKGESEI